jgi:hypothetical protein
MDTGRHSRDQKIINHGRHQKHGKCKSLEPRKARKGSKNSWIFLKNVLPLVLALILLFDKEQYMQNLWQHKLNRFEEKIKFNRTKVLSFAILDFQPSPFRATARQDGGHDGGHCHFITAYTAVSRYKPCLYFISTGLHPWLHAIASRIRD